MVILPDKVAIIRTAITELKQVTAVYDGLERVFCPHILGTKYGVWKVFVWQFDGRSSRGNLPEWRDWFLERLDSVTLQDGEWHRGWTAGKRDQKAVDWIDTVVDPAHAAEVRHTLLPRTPALGLPRQARKKW